MELEISGFLEYVKMINRFLAIQYDIVQCFRYQEIINCIACIIWSPITLTSVLHLNVPLYEFSECE